MNILRKFLTSGQKDDLIMIPSGQLTLSRSPSSPKSESECLYIDAVAVIRRTSQPYHYQLVIQKAMEEGEEQLKDDSDNDDSLDEVDSSDERAFLITQELNFHKYINSEGNTTIVWKDDSGDEGDKFAFICGDNVPETTIDSFMTTIYRLEYERKYKRSSDGVSLADLREFQYDASKHNSALFTREDLLIPNDTETESEFEEEDEEEEEETDEDEFKDAVSGSPVKIPKWSTSKLAKPKAAKPIKGSPIYDTEGDLYFYNIDNNAFEFKKSGAKLEFIDSGNFVYYLQVSFNDKALFSTLVDQNLSPSFMHTHYLFIFNVLNEEVQTSWGLKFEGNPGKLDDLQKNFAEVYWEVLNKAKFSRASEADQDYFVDAFDNLRLENTQTLTADEMEDSSDNETGEEEAPSRILRSTKKYVTYDSNDSDDEPIKNFKKDNEKNKNLTVSYNNERSYVARGNKIGVFKANDENLEFITAIENIKNTHGGKFTPEKMMLHQEDSTLILKDPTRIGNLYKMDLTRGKVVEEYKVEDSDNKLLDTLEVNPTTKFSQLTGEKTFLGLSNNGLYKIDPRLSRNNLVDSEHKKYRTKQNFTAIATNAAGNIAVASKDGEIKLFDRLGINAKTRLPGLGESFKGIDVSADGKWVLATCSSFLLLIDCQISNGKYSGTTGFLRSFDKDNKPMPMMMTLKPQHILLMSQSTKKPIDFTVAHFNVGIDSKETTIIAASGPYIIRWSLKKFLKGDDEPYKILKHNNTIIADNFRYGSNKDAIVALNNDVAIVNKTKFKKPTRESFARR